MACRVTQISICFIRIWDVLVACVPDNSIATFMTQIQAINKSSR